ncbi:MAG: phosphatase PAP2 family protein [Jhaorihella sp.]
MSMHIEATTARAAATGTAAARAGSCPTRLEAALLRHRVLICVVLLHLAGGIAVSTMNERSFETGVVPILLGVFKTLVVVFGCNFLLWRTGYGLFVAKPRRLTLWLAGDLKRCLRNTEMMADGLIVFVTVTIMAATFAYLKDMVPVLNPFSWDPAFAALDRFLHGGIDPWRLLWPVFGNTVLTTALNVAYHLWFFMLYMMVFIATFDRRDPLRRMTFLLAFVLTWIIGGNVLATVFSSAGPVYNQILGFGDTYVAQMDGLKALNETSPVWSLGIQEMLIGNYLADGPIRGISAMPSMHVANAVLMAVFGFTYARWLGWILTGFAALIMIASVHLAWHYAVDGYLGAALALAFWWIAKRLAARFP